jgi:catechol 2,3-dioxygenase-like lactoylglutathione lyase family enzyme
MSVESPLTEIRRFLHCNYNCRDVDLLERFYIGVFGLRAVMRTESSGSDGTPFGIYADTASRTVFLYDHRGGRRSSSLELVQWTEPVTYGSVYPHPWCDLDATASVAIELGGTVVSRGDGWLLMRDPEGVPVEVIAAEGPSQALYLRIVCSDLERTTDWWTAMGLTEGSLTSVAGSEIWPGDAEHHITAERSLVGTDDPSFGIVLTTWDGPLTDGPAYAMPYHQGLFRMALAVDDVHATYAALSDAGYTRQPPYTFQLPGTKLTDGLTIMFIRDPDAILVELVDRPRQV